MPCSIQADPVPTLPEHAGSHTPPQPPRPPGTPLGPAAHRPAAELQWSFTLVTTAFIHSTRSPKHSKHSKHSTRTTPSTRRMRSHSDSPRPGFAIAWPCARFNRPCAFAGRAVAVVYPLGTSDPAEPPSGALPRQMPMPEMPMAEMPMAAQDDSADARRVAPRRVRSARSRRQGRPPAVPPRNVLPPRPPIRACGPSSHSTTRPGKSSARESAPAARPTTRSQSTKLTALEPQLSHGLKKRKPVTVTPRSQQYNPTPRTNKHPFVTPT
jgi:hypothetical protein